MPSCSPGDNTPGDNRPARRSLKSGEILGAARHGAPDNGWTVAPLLTGGVSGSGPVGPLPAMATRKGHRTGSGMSCLRSSSARTAWVIVPPRRGSTPPSDHPAHLPADLPETRYSPSTRTMLRGPGRRPVQLGFRRFRSGLWASWGPRLPGRGNGPPDGPVIRAAATPMSRFSQLNPSFERKRNAGAAS